MEIATKPTPEQLEGLLVLEPRDRFDAAIIGVVERFHDRFVLYSKRAVIDILIAESEPGEEDPETSALEHFDFNMNGGWYGEATWGFLDDLEAT